MQQLLQFLAAIARGAGVRLLGCRSKAMQQLPLMLLRWCRGRSFTCSELRPRPCATLGGMAPTQQLQVSLMLCKCEAAVGGCLGTP